MAVQSGCLRGLRSGARSAGKHQRVESLALSAGRARVGLPRVRAIERAALERTDILRCAERGRFRGRFCTHPESRDPSSHFR